MDIEVTKHTFYKLFDSTNYVNTDNQELANQHNYFNREIDQKGVQVHNFVSNTMQYFLTDINA